MRRKCLRLATRKEMNIQVSKSILPRDHKVHFNFTALYPHKQMFVMFTFWYKAAATSWQCLARSLKKKKNTGKVTWQTLKSRARLQWLLNFFPRFAFPFLAGWVCADAAGLYLCPVFRRTACLTTGPPATTAASAGRRSTSWIQSFSSATLPDRSYRAITQTS